MAFKKNPKVDLKRKYKRVLELGIISSLSLLILAFKFFPNIENDFVVEESAPDIIKAVDVEITRQHSIPPPPRQPEILIPVPEEMDPGDLDIGSTELFPNADVTTKREQPPKNDNMEEEEPTIFIAVEQPPSPIGGLEGIRKRVIYPEMAIRAGIQGKVLVYAYVDENGDVFKVELLKGLWPGCDEAALAAVKDTKFIPGKQRNKPVKVKVAIPISFKIQ